MKRIFWLSFLLLFTEIFALRWLSIEIPVVRVFPNLVIMVCLVAASAGISKANAKSLSPRVAFAIVSVASVLVLAPLIYSVQLDLPSLSIKFGEASEQSTMIRSLSVLMLAVSSLYVVFHCIGKWLGKEFESAPPLAAYSYNLLGSIAGTVVFAIISFCGLSPPFWIAIAGAAAFYLYRKPAVLALTALLVGASAMTSNHSLWSPYSKLDLHPLAATGNELDKKNYALYSNNQYFHLAFRVVRPEETKNFSLQFSQEDKPGNNLWYPYSWLKLPVECAPHHEKMLVLGSGSGQDVAYAIRNGVKQVTAVEIDPVIVKLGRERHPDRPYSDPRVNVRNEDARTFLRYSNEKFDLVEFAFLDPGCTINSASFLRVDNYVYTLESIKAAINLCNKDGIVCLLFATGPDSGITARLYQTILEANGSPPLSYTSKEAASCFFVFGPGQKNVTITPAVVEEASLTPYKPTGEIRACTDQWPFLYLTYDPNGMWLYITVLVVAVVLPALLLFRGGGTGISGAEWANMFFLGQAFMLMETKSITHLSLLLGATWVVSSAVIMTVLVFAWTANLLVSKKRVPPIHVLYGLLLVSLLLQIFIKIPESSNLSPVAITAIYCFIDCFPILFGSMIFSTCFGKTKFTTQALSANLLGVSIGGLTENLCVFIGTSNLTYIAMLLYGMSYLSVLRRGKEFSRAEVGESSSEST